MLKKTVSFDNPFTGDTESVDLYFNISFTEMTEKLLLDPEFPNRIDQVAERATAAVEGPTASEEARQASNKEVYELFQELLKFSYGVQSADGRRHEKSTEIWEKFKGSLEYEALIEEFFVSDGNMLTTFFENLVSADLIKRAQERRQQLANGQPVRPQPQDRLPSAREIAEQKKTETAQATLSEEEREFAEFQAQRKAQREAAREAEDVVSRPPHEG